MQHLNLDRHRSGFFIPHTQFPFIAGVAGRESNTTDYGYTKERIREEEKKILSESLAVQKNRLFFLEQEHGDTVVEAAEPVEESAYVFATADALITNRPDLCLIIRTADCVPVILIDPEATCAGAIHSGWKGTEKKITVKTARLMKERFGAEYCRMKAFIFPSIRVDAYKVGDDLAEKFPLCTREYDDGHHVDLAEAIRRSLVEDGFPDENIFDSGICTFNQNDKFFSHRRGDAGRNLNYVMIRKK